MKKTLDQLLSEDGASSLAGRTVAVRVDFNVPLSDDRITDTIRIDRALPTLERLSEARCRTVLLSHLGRPDGAPDPQFSLRPVADYLSDCGLFPARFCPQPSGSDVDAAVADLSDGDVLLLENTRFVEGETANDPALGQAWAAWADHFVTDAFGTAHRAHASTHALPAAVRAKGGSAVAGYLMERELRYLGTALTTPVRPFVAVLGGAKITGKIDVIESLLPKADALLIGGAMANTFFAALGLETGTSLLEADKTELARDLLERGGTKLVLPVDVVCAERITPGAEARVADRSRVEATEAIGDVGPGTRALFREHVMGAGTVVWNGPMGVFEMAPFAAGTIAMAQAAADASKAGTTVIVGGGDSAAAAEAAGVAEEITHISTGGGASLEFLAGRALPGVEILSEAVAEV
ncbi:MAG: phosphoglycerate kinase [Gemmatimonadota bacterium]|nr:phosphoglycerate kinase [Gemmatimonadota bacterium]